MDYKFRKNWRNAWNEISILSYGYLEIRCYMYSSLCRPGIMSKCCLKYTIYSQLSALQAGMHYLPFMPSLHDGYVVLEFFVALVHPSILVYNDMISCHQNCRQRGQKYLELFCYLSWILFFPISPEYFRNRISPFYPRTDPTPWNI